MDQHSFKNAVVIGNGPSGITASYLLAGNRPFYNGQRHSIDFLQHRLEEGKDKSIMEQDLKMLSEGLEGRSPNPVSVLFDTLNHPLADLGDDNPSVLLWKKSSDWAIDHVVLGKGAAGGAWQKMDGNTLTVSLGSWMELSALSIRFWAENTNRGKYIQKNSPEKYDSNGKRCHSGSKQKRVSVSSVAKYYHDYVQYHDLGQYFVDDTVVTSVSKVTDIEEHDGSFNKNCTVLWNVRGHITSLDQSKSSTFSYVTPNVVLATGNSDQPNKLNVEGDHLPFVLYSLGELEELISRGELSSTSGNLMIVGAGLSAADAVIAARFHNISIVHVFRCAVCDPKLIFNKLPTNVYPEYSKVHQMMQDSNRELYEGYKAFPLHRVQKIKLNRTVTLVSTANEACTCDINVSHVLILIGMHPDLSFLPDGGKNLGIYPNLPIDCKSNPIDINLYTHESVHSPGLYAVGPLVGDNFVRFVQGGGLAVSSHIWRKFLKK